MPAVKEAIGRHQCAPLSEVSHREPRTERYVASTMEIPGCFSVYDLDTGATVHGTEYCNAPEAAARARRLNEVYRDWLPDISKQAGV